MQLLFASCLHFVRLAFFAAKLYKKAQKSPRQSPEIGCRGCNSKTSFINSGYFSLLNVISLRILLR